MGFLVAEFSQTDFAHGRVLYNLDPCLVNSRSAQSREWEGSPNLG